MVGYTRQAEAQIQNNSLADATDLNLEFDAIEATFNAVTGHSHDGTSGDGAPITTLGPNNTEVVITSGTTSIANTLSTASPSFTGTVSSAGAVSIAGGFGITTPSGNLPLSPGGTGLVSFKDGASSFSTLFTNAGVTANRQVSFPNGAVTLSPGTMMTTDTAQTISAEKTFSTGITVATGEGDGINSPSNIHIQAGGSGVVYLKNGAASFPVGIISSALTAIRFLTMGDGSTVLVPGTMATLNQINTREMWAGTVGGTVNARTLTVDSTVAYAVGLTISFFAPATNTGATTVNVNGLGVKNVLTATGVALPANYLRVTTPNTLVYDGTNFVALRAFNEGQAVGDLIPHIGEFTNLNVNGFLAVSDEIYHQGDSDTRIRFPASDTISFETAGAERMRINNAGAVLFGTEGVPNGTSIYGSAFFPGGSGRMQLLMASNVTTNVAIQAFYNPNGLVGSISTNASATAYNTSSDYRLKNVSGPIQNSGAYIDSLNPVEGTWKADGSPFVGLIAHEAQEVSRTPVATGEKDGDEMQGMDYSSAEIIANLIAEVQELRKRVASLEEKVV